MHYSNKAIKDYWFTSGGIIVDNFAIAIKNYLDCELFVAGLNVGSVAIYLGVVLLGVQAGDVLLFLSMAFQHWQILLCTNSLLLFI